jgi:CHAT domain-containing protein/tetratricopeptide (TPR) repeat protein
MKRCVSILGLVLLGVFESGVQAADPPEKLTPEKRKELAAKQLELNTAGLQAYRAGKYAEAIKAFEAALEVTRRLYPKAEFPDGHNNLAVSLSNLGFLYLSQGRYAAAEPLCQEALAMYRRLFKGDHPSLALSLNNLANLYQFQGKYAAAEELYKAALTMRWRLFKGHHPDLAASLNNLANLYQAEGRYMEAELFFKAALEMHRRLFQGNHPDLATSLNNLAALYWSQGRYAAAEPLFKEALEMTRRLFKGDHPHLALLLHNLAGVQESQGKYAAAEALYKEALAMYRRLFKDDHPDLAASLNHLGLLYWSQGQHTAAEPLFKEALMMRRRLFKGDHPDLVDSLNHLANLYQDQGKPAAAESRYKEALAMSRRLFKGDHPDLANSLHNLASLYVSQGKYGAAEPLHKEAVAMRRRILKGDHPSLALSLNNFGALYWSEEKYTAAAPLFKEALEMTRRLTTRFAGEKREGEALTLLASLPPYRDAFLSNELARKANPALVYPQLWFEKGVIARVCEQRHQQARAAATDPKITRLLDELAQNRRRRAELLLAPALKDPATRAQRDADLKDYDDRLSTSTRRLRLLLPTLDRADRLADAQPSALQKVLPADAAVIDFLRFVHFEQDPKLPGKKGEKRTARYLAFVVTREKIAWVDLDTAAKIEAALTAWREAITENKEVPPELPAKGRTLVWDRVRQELPVSIKTVYLCPDAVLCRLPFTALPGDKPGTILLEDFALATVPHATFLLDKLWPPDPLKNPPSQALVVGGVQYDADLAATPPDALAQRGPLVRPGAKLGWPFLPATVGEAHGVATAAERKKLPTTRLAGAKATTAAVLATLPKAKYAHLATHGFFADPSFRGLFQLDERDYEKSVRGERIGRAANSPLVMTGLVLAGANQPKTPARSILTGEALIDLDLSGLELAVLSACETGLGDVAGGEGTFGLQRAFHLAGTRNVVASLWKVSDQATAALMALFYRNLWDKGLPPIEALRQAQLEIYRHPDKIPQWAAGFRGKFVEVPGSSDEAVKPGRDGKAPPRLWAAFTLSGPGR